MWLVKRTCKKDRKQPNTQIVQCLYIVELMRVEKVEALDKMDTLNTTYRNKNMLLYMIFL